MKPLVVAKNCLKGTKYSRDGIHVKEEPLEDDFVSILQNRSKLKLNLHKLLFNCSYSKFNHVNWGCGFELQTLLNQISQ